MSLWMQKAPRSLLSFSTSLKLWLLQILCRSRKWNHGIQCFCANKHYNELAKMHWDHCHVFFFLYSRLKCHRNYPTRHYRNDASFTSAHQQNSTYQTPANKTCRCIVAQSLHKNAQECRLTKIQTFQREKYEASWYGCKRKSKHLIVPA